MFADLFRRIKMAWTKFSMRCRDSREISPLNLRKSAYIFEFLCQVDCLAITEAPLQIASSTPNFTSLA